VSDVSRADHPAADWCDGAEERLQSAEDGGSVQVDVCASAAAATDQ